MNVCVDTDEIIVLGDFNSPRIDWINALDGDHMILLNVSSELRVSFIVSPVRFWIQIAFRHYFLHWSVLYWNMHVRYGRRFT